MAENNPKQETKCDIAYKYCEEFSENTRCFDDADSLISAIESFHAKSGNRYIYRGQRCFSWLLLPAILRSQNPDVNQYRDMLKEYMRIGYYNGLTLPLDNPFEAQIDPNRQRLLFLNTGPADVPHAKAPSAVVAHAQHYGLPTELLDATRDPLVACFFTTWNNGCENKEDANKSVIWIFNEQELYARTNLRVFTYPISASFTPNQKSVFVWNSTWDFAGDTYMKPFEEELLRIVSIDGAFYRYVISEKATVELRGVLDKRGITYASMFPDWRDFANSIKVKRGFR